MKLTDLEPQFLKRLSDLSFETEGVSFANADGIMFLCPKCFVGNAGPIGTHSVICWRPHVPQTTTPVPGRWEFQGTGLHDLTLVAGSSSVHLTGEKVCVEPGGEIGSGWHGFITNGEVLTC